MSAAVKPWDPAKPFRRINNDAVLAAQKATRHDGDGIACGCQVPEQYPGLQQTFDDAFKDFKPGRLQAIIQEVQKRAHQISVGLQLVSLITAPAAIIALRKVAELVDAVMEQVDKEITKLMSQVGIKLARRALHVMPQWVPVLQGASNEGVTADQITEVEGVAKRSFMNPIDVPFRQWHHWFNWNIHITPEPGYDVISVEDPPNTEGAAFPEEHPVVEGRTISVQWDAGALWAADVRELMAAGFKGPAMATFDGPMLQGDWAWPMMNSYVWAAGRWVYDCSRTTTSDPPRMCTMINPCKAIASARWQGFIFPENESEIAVPAIQFMFFACKRGGYIDYPTITDTDYEFIVDLPRITRKPDVPFPIGHTPEFPHNTIVMRPRLLLDLNQKAFSFTDSKPIEPIVEIIQPGEPDKAPEQVKIIVPLTVLPAEAEACGFILSMGWYDPALKDAEKVRKCEVNFTHFSGIVQSRNSLVKVIRDELAQDEQRLLKEIERRIGELDVPLILGQSVQVKNIPLLGSKLQQLGAAVVKELLDLFGDVVEEDWLLRIGVNGHWESRYLDGLKRTDLPKLRLPPLKANVLLSDDKALSMSANGASFGPVGDLMRQPAAKRTFRFDGTTPNWSRIVTPDADEGRAKEIRQNMAVAYAIDLLGRGSAGFGLGRDNQPLGYMDPMQTTPMTATGPRAERNARGQNPVPAGKAGTGIRNEAHEQTMFFARALPGQKILVEDYSKNDYSIFYDLSIDKQDEV